ncbi:MAG: lipoyl(octanoyl) transferase LipB [Candidatus Binatia bacterium]
MRPLGRCAYGDAMALQESVVAGVIAGTEREQLLLLEHPPLYTLGRGGDADDLRDAPHRLGIPAHRVGRGGGATFHGPGQLVAYPIVRLRRGSVDVRGYVSALEQALIETCEAYGLAATAPAGQVGVWVRGAKIASIGIGVRRGITFHGVALNVSTDLQYFEQIVACRVPELTLTSMAAELEGGAPALPEVGAVLARALGRQLGRELEGAEAPWP